MAITYEPVNPPIIPNTIMQKRYLNDVHKQYLVEPADDYVLHDKALDWTEIDPDTLEEMPKLGYTRGTCTCAATYDFVANPREFYAVPETDIPADQIFGIGNNDHEVM